MEDPAIFIELFESSSNKLSSIIDDWYMGDPKLADYGLPYKINHLGLNNAGPWFTFHPFVEVIYSD